MSFYFMSPFHLPTNSSFWDQSSWFTPSIQAIPFSYASIFSVFSLRSFNVSCIILFLSSTYFKVYDNSSFSISSHFHSSQSFSPLTCEFLKLIFSWSNSFAFCSISYFVFSILLFTNSKSFFGTPKVSLCF